MENRQGTSLINIENLKASIKNDLDAFAKMYPSCLKKWDRLDLNLETDSVLRQIFKKYSQYQLAEKIFEDIAGIGKNKKGLYIVSNPTQYLKWRSQFIELLHKEIPKEFGSESQSYESPMKKIKFNTSGWADSFKGTEMGLDDVKRELENQLRPLKKEFPLEMSDWEKFFNEPPKKLYARLKELKHKYNDAMRAICGLFALERNKLNFDVQKFEIWRGNVPYDPSLKDDDEPKKEESEETKMRRALEPIREKFIADTVKLTKFLNSSDKNDCKLFKELIPSLIKIRGSSNVSAKMELFIKITGIYGINKYGTININENFRTWLNIPLVEPTPSQSSSLQETERMPRSANISNIQSSISFFPQNRDEYAANQDNFFEQQEKMPALIPIKKEPNLNPKPPINLDAIIEDVGNALKEQLAKKSPEEKKDQRDCAHLTSYAIEALLALLNGQPIPFYDFSNKRNSVNDGSSDIDINHEVIKTKQGQKSQRQITSVSAIPSKTGLNANLAVYSSVFNPEKEKNFPSIELDLDRVPKTKSSFLSLSDDLKKQAYFHNSILIGHIGLVAKKENGTSHAVAFCATPDRVVYFEGQSNEPVLSELSDDSILMRNFSDQCFYLIHHVVPALSQIKKISISNLLNKS